MKFPLLVAPEVDKMTTYSAASDENSVTMTTVLFRYIIFIQFLQKRHLSSQSLSSSAAAKIVIVLSTLP